LMGDSWKKKFRREYLTGMIIAVLAFELTVAIETYLEDNEERNVT